MKYAIVESGGKQYKAVEGETIDVDRLPVEVGGKVDLKSVLLTVDGKEVTVGNPSVAGIQVSTTVVNHFKGPKIVVFKYSPKKRIRVRRGHRQQYTRLQVEVIGKPGEARKAAKVEKAEAPPKAEAAKTPASTKKASAAKTTKPAAKKTRTAKPATKAAPKKTTGTKAPAKTSGKKSTASKAPAKKSTTSKAPAKKSTTSRTPAKKPSTTKTKKTTK